uniref:Putative ovule protein n=1 Tax=Solanum chacoense TaxID=4108 RepID=A0A0V0H2F1_SOLCH
MGGVAMAVPGAGISAGTDVVLSRVDGSLRDATVYDRLPSHRYAYRSSSYLEGPNTITGDAYSRPPPYMETLWGCQTPHLVMLIGHHHTHKALQGCQIP